MADDTRWQRVDDLFRQALELTGDEREALLDGCDDEEMRAQVRRLLTFSEESRELGVPRVLLEGAAGDLAERGDPTDPAALPTQHLTRAFETGEVVAGRYRLDHLVGTRGMGTIFRGRDLKLDLDERPRWG